MSSRLLLVPFLALTLACDQSTLIDLPEAGGEDACVPHAVVFCDAGSSGCVGGGASDPNVALLPGDAAYPVGCIANVTGTTRNTVTGVCNLTAECTCEAAPDAGDAAAPTWDCAP